MFINHTTGANGESVITAVDGAEVIVFDSSHPNYAAIFAALSGNDMQTAFSLYNIEQAVQESFAKLDDDVYLEDGELIFNGEVVNNALSAVILRLHEDQEDFEPLVKFLRRLYSNPNEHSREMLFDWMLEAGGFTINPDGTFIGYRGLRSDLTSKNSGPGIINGEKHNGHLDNSPGNVIEMYRNEVTFDPANSCAFGLHVGTYNYAESWGEVVVSVVVDPADVVSVPSYEHAKMRVCRYKVLEIVSEKINDVINHGYEDESDDDYDDDLDDDFDDDDEDTWY